MDDFNNYLHKKFGKKRIGQPVPPVETETEKADEDCVFVQEFKLPQVFPCNGQIKSPFHPLMSFPYNMSRLFLCNKGINCRNNHFNNIGLNRTGNIFNNIGLNQTANHFNNVGLNLTTNLNKYNSDSIQTTVLNEANDSLLEGINSESAYIEDLLKYHSNMVRSFKTKTRTAKDQLRRDQNTILCRIYRRRKKIENLELEYEIECLKNHYLKIMKERTRCYHYTNELLRLIQVKLIILTKFKNNPHCAEPEQ
ncbi:probable basic-leucine zipper transcription factor G [Condylostylus longicornis]|uniref:probable basic-leucine zipper transcription factor G n=1 Tax=Condylostylus longicornis TaxID=2530218 RepID=UPI00244E0C73|nr:probable basic-leucine zipper transcription factor G [Condylostylus longicornis]